LCRGGFFEAGKDVGIKSNMCTFDCFIVKYHLSSKHTRKEGEMKLLTGRRYL
jgi:hypothetical protein